MEEIWRALLANLHLLELYGVLLAVIAGFLVAEHFFPAERKQPVRPRILTGAYTLIYFFAIPLVVVIPMAIATAVSKATGGSLFSLDLNRLSTGSQGLDWGLRNIVYPFLPFVVFDFF